MHFMFVKAFLFPHFLAGGKKKYAGKVYEGVALEECGIRSPHLTEK